jgi:hypothetical protein
VPTYTKCRRAALSPSYDRHTPPPGLAFGGPDDRLLRGIQYAAASRFYHRLLGILDHPLSRMMMTVAFANTPSHSRNAKPGFCKNLPPIRAWGIVFLRALPDDRAFLSPSSAGMPAGLTPASRRHDHTTSLSAPAPFVFRRHPHPSHPAPLS